MVVLCGFDVRLPCGVGVLIQNGADSNTIRGNVLSGNVNGVDIRGVGTEENVVVGNFIGTDASGMVGLGNTNNGVIIKQGASRNLIGIDSDGIPDRNVIAFSPFGVAIRDEGTEENTVAANYIGTDKNGTGKLGNAIGGVAIFSGAANNLIGGSDSTARNVISGNDTDGVRIVDANGNRVQGNYIGMDPAGRMPVGNGRHGILIFNGSANFIGTDGDGLGDETEGNLISGNQANGVTISNSHDNHVAGNWIGTDATGEDVHENGLSGVVLNNGSTNNFVGADGGGDINDAAANVISGNSSYGVRIQESGTNSNVVTGNRIGTNHDGSKPLGNGTNYGVRIEEGAQGNSVLANTISSNFVGVHIRDAGTDNNTVSDNFIGTDESGTFSLGTQQRGVDIYFGAQFNTVRGNFISGNRDRGVHVVQSDNNTIAGNVIGLDRGGDFPLTNGIGIQVDDSDNITIGLELGSSNDGDANVISGNAEAGIDITGGSQNVGIRGNFVGLGTDGDTIIGNGVGIRVRGGSTHVTIGGLTLKERNVISGNTAAGIQLGDSLHASDVDIFGNYIGADITGTLPRGNFGAGIELVDGDDVEIGGAASGAGNTISANNGAGILIHAASTGAMIQGNRIGTDRTGTADLGNSAGIEVYQAALIGSANDTAAGNIIAFSSGNGVTIIPVGLTGPVTIRRNSIHSNDGLGIDYGDDGVTDNGSGTQDYPVISTVTGGANTRIQGSVHGPAGAEIRIDVFAQPAADVDPSNHGEGRRFLGSQIETANAEGDVEFDFTLLGATTVRGEVITATATSVIGATSEFSQAVETRFEQAPTITEDNLIVTILEDFDAAPGSENEGDDPPTYGEVTRFIPENQVFRLDALFESPDPDDFHTVTVNWGDGQKETVTLEPGLLGFTLEHLYEDDTLAGTPSDPVIVSVVVTDSDGASGSATIDLVIVNVAPTLNGDVIITPSTASEGDVITLTGDLFDPGLLDTHTVSVTWGDGSSDDVLRLEGVTDFVFTHRYRDDNGSGAVPILLRLTDKDSGETIVPVDFSVSNVAPLASVIGTGGLHFEGSEVALTAAVTDSGIQDTHSYQWTAAGADGFLATSTEETFRFVPPDSGEYQVSLVVTDDDGGTSATETAALQIQNVAPTIDPADLSFRDVAGNTVTSIEEGSPVALVGTFNDPGIESHAVVVDWDGDGEVDDTINLPAGVTSFSFSHVYPDDPEGALDAISVKVTVTDADGGFGDAEKSLTIANVDPVVQIRDNGSDGATIRLTSIVTDAGSDDFSYAWTAILADPPGQTIDVTPADQPTLTFPRPMDGIAIVTLQVGDFDGGMTTQTVVFIAGTDGDDFIFVIPDGANLNVDVNNVTRNVGNADVILISTGGGADSVFVRNDVTTRTRIVTGDGADTIISGSGDDFLDGGPGPDTVFAGNGNDVLLSVGDDSLAGGNGNDTYIILGFSDKVLDESGSDGTDTIDFDAIQEGVTLDLGTRDEVQAVTNDDDMTLKGDFENLVGTDFNDTLTGNELENLIDAGDGDDLVFDGAGNDSFLGGGGNDSILGGEGNDVFEGGDGDDTILSGEGNDTTTTGDGSDTFFVNGDDTIFGGEGNDLIFDGAGNDSFLGGGGNDSIFGSVGDDVFDGGTGDDTIIGGMGNETMSAGEGGGDDMSFFDGEDTVFGGEGNDLIFDGAGDDSYLGGGGNDSILGGEGNDVFDGGDGDDTILSSEGNDTTTSGNETVFVDGNDTILGGEGNDLIFDGAGDDSYLGGGGDDSILGGQGNDVFDAGDGNDTIISSAGNDTTTTADGMDTVFVDGNDTIFGGEGNDLIFDGAGDDSYLGGGGDDSIVGGEGNDVFDAGAGDDTILSSVGNDTTTTADGSDTVFVDGNDTIFGGEGNDLIFDGAGDDSYLGGGGDDSILGGEGDDVYDGGDGDDTILSGQGNDTSIFVDGNDTILGGEGNDLIFDGAGDDSYLGGGGDDSILGGEGDDVYDGGDGDDTILSGEGNDTSIFVDGNDTVLGGEGNDLIFDGAGDDSYLGGGGDDSILGGEGDDLYDGGDGNDTILSGAGSDASYVDGNDTVLGGEGNDLIFDGAGNDSYLGGGGDDSILGAEGNDSFDGGAGNDSILAGDGNDVADGGLGNDTLNSGDGLDTIFGAEGNDLIFGGPQTRLIDAGAGNDGIISTTEPGAQTEILGNAGSDTILSGDGDETVSGGAGDNDWLIEIADVDMLLNDTTLTASGVTEHSGFEKVQLVGGDSDNLLDASAFTGDAVLIGGLGDDTLLGGSGDDILNGGGGNDSLVGGGGNDIYQFDQEAAGSDVLNESPADPGVDALDFGFFDHAVTVDLNSTTEQLVGANLSVTLPEGENDFEDLIGTAFSDKLIGNDLDNKLFGRGGQDLIDGGAGSDLVQANITKRVFLDFDTQTGPGEHIYTPEERNAIQQRIEADYADFDFEFTQTKPVEGGFVTVLVNATPLFDGVPQAGGRASQLGWRIVELSGTVIVDVNGFLGEGNGLAPTSANFIALSSTIIAHELGHQFGLRHHDSFGDLGNGIYDKLDPARFLPQYPGPALADQTRFHLSASPGSVRTSLVDAAGNPFFGERERIKLAFAETGRSISEIDPPAGSPTIMFGTTEYAAQDLGSLEVISVPIDGQDQGVAALNVEGRIELAGANSESDFYAIQAEANDLLTVEILSASLSRIGESIDSVLRIYDADGNRLAYHGNPLGAFNDDNLELTDSILLDVLLPMAGTYFIEVDTFQFRSPEFSTYLPDFDVDAFEAQFPLHPGVLDTDTGDYELFIYRTSSDIAQLATTGDTIIGGTGEDVLVGSSGRDEVLGFNLLQDELIDRSGAATFRAGDLSVSFEQSAVNEGETFSLVGQLTGQLPDFVTIDWGDGSIEEFQVSDLGTFVANHDYEDDPPGAEPDRYILTVSVDNPEDPITLSVPVGVKNVAPQNVDAGENRILRLQGQAFELTASFIDVPADDITIDWNVFDPSGQLLVTGSGESFEFTPPDNLVYLVELTVSDDDGGQGTDFVQVFTQNAPPQNVAISGDFRVGETEPVTLFAEFDDAISDTHSFVWQVAATNGQRIDPWFEREFTFTPEDNGEYQVTLTVTDDEKLSSNATAVVTVVNLPPVVSIDGPISGIREQERTFTFTAADPSAKDVIFEYQIDWDGDGTFDEVIADADSSIEVVHTYDTTGLFTIRAIATDGDGGRSAVATHEIDIRHIDLQPDPWDENALAVIVGGTPLNDQIDFVALGEAGVTAEIRTGSDDSVRVDVVPVPGGYQLTIDPKIGDLQIVDIASVLPIARLIAYGQAGDDLIRVSSDLAIDSLIDGGAGLDILIGGGGDNFLLGGEGNDALFGGNGRDILIGGFGADRLLGQGQEDLLIGGFLQFDDSNSVIREIARIWNDRMIEYADRVAMLSDPANPFGLIEGETVVNDGDQDILQGGLALDWFISDEDEDIFHATLDEIFNGIDQALLDI